MGSKIPTARISHFLVRMINAYLDLVSLHRIKIARDSGASFAALLKSRLKFYLNNPCAKFETLRNPIALSFL